MYGIFSYIYHQIEPNVCKYMEHLGKELRTIEYGKVLLAQEKVGCERGAQKPVISRDP